MVEKCFSKKTRGKSFSSTTVLPFLYLLFPFGSQVLFVFSRYTCNSEHTISWTGKGYFHVRYLHRNTNLPIFHFPLPSPRCPGLKDVRWNIFLNLKDLFASLQTGMKKSAKLECITRMNDLLQINISKIRKSTLAILHEVINYCISPILRQFYSKTQRYVMSH